MVPAGLGVLAVVELRGVAAGHCQEINIHQHGRDHDQALAGRPTRAREARAFRRAQMVLGQGRARISRREATEQFHDCFYIRLPACPSTPSTPHAIEREPHHEERSTTNRARVCREPQCSFFEAQEFLEQRGAHGVDSGRPAAQAGAIGAAHTGGRSSYWIAPPAMRMSAWPTLLLATRLFWCSLLRP